MSEKNYKKTKMGPDFTQIEQFASLLTRLDRRMHSGEGFSFASMAAAYVLYLAACDEKCLDIPDLKAFLVKMCADSQLRSFIIDLIGKDWDSYRRCIRNYHKEDIARYILNYNPDGRVAYGTVDSVAKLAIRMMDVKTGDTVADICCGGGNFLKVAAEECKGCRLTGFERSADMVCVAKIRAAVLGDDIDIIFGDTLTSGVKYQKKFDCVFCDPPYSMRLEHVNGLNMSNGEFRTDFFPASFPSLKGRSTAEWIWLLKALDMMKQDGKAAVVMPLGRLFSAAYEERQCRRFLVENRLVETVVALPPSLLDYTGIRLGLVILSKKDNDSVRFIEANNLCVKQKSKNIMTDEQINRIVSATENDECCRIVGKPDIADEEFSLDPSAYIYRPTIISNSVPLSSLVTIGRGMATPTESDAIDLENSPIRFVTVSDIRDWQISGEVKPLGEMNSRYNRYIIDNDDIVIGKVPAPFKEAVAQIPEGKIYVASVNCYILKVDKSKCDPYYLMAFLCSKLGQEQISRILTGVTLRTITIEGLEKIQVPMVSLEKQKIFAEAFKKKINFTHISRLQVEKAVQDTEGAFDTFMKEEEKC